MKTAKATFYPFSVVPHGKKVMFVYGVKTPSETRIFLSQSEDGLTFGNKYELHLTDENGQKKSLFDCGQLSFFAYGNQANLIFSQTSKGEKQILIAQSSDLLNFKITAETSDVAALFPIVSNFKYKKNFLTYFGGESLQVAASDNLVHWHKTGSLLPKRAEAFFDEGAALHVIGTVIVPRGILVLYDARVDKKSNYEIKIGCALFSLDKPYAPIWRSQLPLWEESVAKKKYDVRFLGCALVKQSLQIYWSSFENEFFVKTINLASSGLVPSEKARQLKRHASNPILKPEPANSWEKDATFNPAALCLEGKIHLLYRAIGENGISVLGYANSRDGISISERLDQPVFSLAENLRIQQSPSTASPYVSGGSWAGCEDPRATQIGKRIFVTYVFFDGCNPPGVALTSIKVQDFLSKDWKWKKPKLISKAGEIQKNWMIFPEKINGKYAILHSITPKISIEYVDDLDGEEITIESSKKPGLDEHRWDNVVRGAGAPPLLTKYGWLLLYHAMDKRDPDKYKVGALILDYQDPTKILHRCTYPILEPTAHYENHGAKAGVVYVCGAAIKDETLFVYYGGADSVICVATEKLDEFLEGLIASGEVAGEEVAGEEVLQQLQG